ncbi:MAG: M16 family metallopeptidase [Chitinophagales bacterium]
MINYKEYQLKNGLRVLVDEDDSTPMASVNILYHVGAKNERKEKTGFAHFFEHFMFEGSTNAPHFDSEIQKAGGENNAFTTNDLTNYYETLPATNIETAFWLESDRMLELNFNQESLDTQISVVSEEFKENYINKPYGDTWHKISALTYKHHPYQWPTIGLKLEHIAAFTLEECKDFFYQYYRPNNAILTVSGGVKAEKVFALAEKWFGDIPRGEAIKRDYAKEPAQTEKRIQNVEANVPANAIYKAYPICDRLHADYYATDLISDVLGSGSSSRLYQQLVKEQQLFSEISAYISGTDDAGLLLIEGKVAQGIKMEDADNAIIKLLESFKAEKLDENELQKVINKTLNYLAFSTESHFNKAFNMAYFTMIDKQEWINNEDLEYKKITTEDIQNVAQSIFREENSNTLFYHAKKGNNDQ